MKRKSYSVKRKNGLKKKIKTMEYGKKYYEDVLNKKKEVTKKDNLM